MKKTFWSSLLLATALSTTANAQSIFEALSSAYETNPTLQAQRAYLRSIDENVAIAKSGYRPSLALTGSYTDASVDSNVEPKIRIMTRRFWPRPSASPCSAVFLPSTALSRQTARFAPSKTIFTMWNRRSFLTLQPLILTCCRTRRLLTCRKTTKNF